MTIGEYKITEITTNFSKKILFLIKNYKKTMKYIVFKILLVNLKRIKI